MVNQLFHWYFLEELSACHMLLTKKMYNNLDHLLLSENKHLVLSFGKAIGIRNMKSRFPHICHPQSFGFTSVEYTVFFESP